MALWSERHVKVEPQMYYRVLIGLAADYEQPNREPICITDVEGTPKERDYQVVVGAKIEYRENELPSTDNAIGFYIIVRKRIDSPDKSEIPETDTSVDDSPAWRPADDTIAVELEYPPSPPTFEQVANTGTSDSRIAQDAVQATNLSHPIGFEIHPPAQTFTQMAATMCNGSTWKGISKNLTVKPQGSSCPEGIQ